MNAMIQMYHKARAIQPQRESGFSNPLIGEEGGQESPPSRESGFSNPLIGEGGQESPPSRESGLSNPLIGEGGGQESPPSVGGFFLNPYGEIEKTSHHLPHWQQDETWVFVTWRLADSLPKAKLDQWKVDRDSWLKRYPKPWTAATRAAYHERFSGQLEAWLDQGGGSCVLKDRLDNLYAVLIGVAGAALFVGIIIGLAIVFPGLFKTGAK